MTQMQIEERRVGEVTVLRLRGRLVLEEGEAPLRAHIDGLIADGRTDIVLNMNAVNYIDSSGVGAIAAKFLSVRRRGGDLKLVDLSERVHHVLDITGLLPVLMPVHTEAEALRSFTIRA